MKKQMAISLCCSNRRCCYDHSCDTSLQLARDHGGVSFSETYLNTLFNIRHVIKKVAIGGWFFAFWIDCIAFDCSSELHSLSLNEQFLDTLREHFAQCLERKFQCKISSRGVAFLQSQVEYRPVAVLASARDRNRRCCEMEKKLGTYCEYLLQSGYPFMIVYNDCHGVLRCQADEVTKPLVTERGAVWDDVILPCLRQEADTVCLQPKRKRAQAPETPDGWIDSKHFWSRRSEVWAREGVWNRRCAEPLHKGE